MQKFRKRSVLVLSIIGAVFSSIYIFSEYQKRLALDWQQKNVVILLTMAIDPQGTIAVARSKVSDRIEDYKVSLSRWAQLPYRVVVVESSGYGNPFTDILATAKNISYISQRLPHIPARGKGYGEAQIIQYAMDNLITDNNVYIIKFTGRYAPKEDLAELMQILQQTNPSVLHKPNRSEWLVAKRDFYLNFAANCIQTCDDTKGKDWYFEGHLDQLAAQTKGEKSTNLIIKVIPTRTGSNNQPTTQI